MTAHKLKTARSVGRDAFHLTTDVLAGAEVVGTIRAHHAGSGWGGRLSEYHFTPNEAGTARGLRKTHGDTLRATLAAALPKV